MTIGNAINGRYFSYVSPTINFKTVGNTTIFTTIPGSKFVPTTYTFICDTASAVVGDLTVNVGWTAAAFSDFLSGSTTSLTTADTFDNYQSVSAPNFPAATAIVLRVATGDTGTTFTGRFVLSGFYME